MLEINYDKINNSVIIGTENSSGAEYHCSDTEDLKNSINEYIDNYIDYTYDMEHLKYKGNSYEEDKQNIEKDVMELG